MTEVLIRFLDLCKYAIDNAVPILTSLGMVVAAVASLRNGQHLARQDKAIKEVDTKVDGQMTEFTATTKGHTDALADLVKDQSEKTAEVVKDKTDRIAEVLKDKTDRVAEALKDKTDKTAEDLRADVARLHEKVERLSAGLPVVAAVIAPPIHVELIGPEPEENSQLEPERHPDPHAGPGTGG